MGIVIRRYEPADADPIARLNQRLAAAAVPYPVYPEDPPDADSGSGDRSALCTRLFVAVEGKEVRGGVWLTEQEFQVNGGVQRLGWVRYPVSESLIGAEFAGVPGALMFRLLKEQPQLMALGLGGHDGVFARVLARLDWAGSTIPFYFAIVQPSRVLREMAFLRRTAAHRFTMDALAWSGLGWMAYRGVESLRSVVSPRLDSSISWESEPDFGGWADTIWERNVGKYGFASVRRSEVLNQAYPRDSDAYTVLRVRRSGKDIGWVYVLRKEMRRGRIDPHFGRLVVGVIVDSFGDPADARSLMVAGTNWLRESNVDLIISNQQYPAMCAALQSIGFFRGPSRFAFYRAPAVEKLLSVASVQALGMHVTRGDCDGPGRV